MRIPVAMLTLLFLAMPAAADVVDVPFTITVTPPPNRPPVASPGTATTPRDVPVRLVPQVTDPDGDQVRICGIKIAPQHGTVTMGADGAVTYTPAAGYIGSDSLTIEASDRPCTSSLPLPPPVTVGQAWISDPRSIVQVPKPSQPGDVLGLRLVADAATGPRVVTFGQAFIVGQLAAGQGLAARIGGSSAPVQVACKSSWEDRSCRHAVLSVMAPAMTSGQSIDVMLVPGPAPTGTALTVAEAAVNAVLAVTPAGGSQMTVQVGPALAAAAAAGKAEAWIIGPLAAEWRVMVPLVGDLKAVFDVRIEVGGVASVDVIVARDATWTASPDYGKPRTYAVSLVADGATVYQNVALVHFQNANWHRVIGAPPIRVIPDVDHLLATGATAVYDPSVPIASTMLSALAGVAYVPMGWGSVERAMPGTGARQDIAPLPSWTVACLLSQDPRACDAMRANADASGSVPWHFRDEATKQWVRIDQHPALMLSPNQPAGPGTDLLPVKYDPRPTTGWEPDNAHEPSLTYLPYLLTGRHYYLDELQAQTAFNLAAIWPGHRQAGNWWEYYPQLRQEAWDLRTLAQTVFITPDSDPMKPYFTSMLNHELGRLYDAYVTRGVTNGAGDTEGWFLANYPSDVIAPWQEDYMALTLAQLAHQGFSQAESLLQWSENYLAGRFLNGDNGYNPMAGVEYWLGVNKPYNGAFYSTWSAWFDATEGGKTITEIGNGFGYPHLSTGAAAISRGAMAELFNAILSVDALAGYAYVVSQTQNAGMVTEYPKDPAWLATLRLPDGRLIATADMRVATGSGPATLAGGDRPGLLIGGPAADTLTAGAGTVVLIGGDGNDTIKGGPGGDYLYGGKGDDVLTGGPGADRFVFDKNCGNDVITDFTPGEDRIVFGTANVANKGLTAAGLLAGATVDGSGNLVLHPGSGSTITLVGIGAGGLPVASIGFGK